MRDLYFRNFEEDEDSEDAWDENPTGIDNAIGKLFPEPILIPAMDDATEDISKHKRSTTIGKLISEILKPIERDREDEINEILDGLRERFEAGGDNRNEELQAFDHEANQKIDDFFPGVEIKVHMPTPEIGELFKSGTVKITEDGYQALRDFDSLGHGAQRSIQMALIRQLAETSRNTGETGRTLLLIEEPELFLHPQGVWRLKKALKNLSSGNYQIIVTTHSPLMLNKMDIPKTILIRKNKEEGTHRLKSIEEAVKEKIEDHSSQADLLFALRNSSKILFSEEIILLEGRTESQIVPVAYELISDNSELKSEIAFVPLRSSGDIIKAIEILDEMQIKVKAITDLDFTFKEAYRNGFLEEEDDDIQACKILFAEKADDLAVKLSEDGWPKKNKENNTSAEEAYEKLAIEEDIQRHIENLHKKLRDKNIWVWKTGAIEKPFGIMAKNDRARAKLLTEMEQAENPIDQVDSPELVQGLINWLNE